MLLRNIQFLLNSQRKGSSGWCLICSVSQQHSGYYWHSFIFCYKIYLFRERLGGHRERETLQQTPRWGVEPDAGLHSRTEILTWTELKSDTSKLSYPDARQVCFVCFVFFKYLRLSSKYLLLAPQLKGGNGLALKLGFFSSTSCHYGLQDGREQSSISGPALSPGPGL